MDELKKKIFKFGMFGKPIGCLSKTEIEDLKRSSWAQFFHKDDLYEIQKEVEFVPREVRDFANSDEIYVRMLFPYFKRTISEAKFKEMSSFRIFDHLLTTDDFVMQRDLMKIGNVGAKKVSYVLKILRQCDFVIKKVIGNVSYVKLDSEKLFMKYSRENNPPVIPTSYSRDSPVSHEIKKRLLSSETGLMSGDISREFGFSVKRSLMYLKKIQAEYSEKIGVRAVFEGKNRKQLFFIKENKTLDPKIKEMGLVTIEDRVKALEEIIAGRKWITTCEKTCSLFKEKLGVKYKPDRKTLIATAIKANLRVFNIKGIHSTSSFFIANKDTDLRDILKNKMKVTAKESEFSKSIMTKYVKNSVLICLDNLYEPKLSKRVELLCKVIQEACGHNRQILSDEFLLDQSALLLFNIVTFNKVCFVNKLVEGLTNLSCTQKDKEDLTKANRDYLRDILKGFTIREVLNSPIDDFLKKEINEKIENKTLLKSFMEPIWMNCFYLFINQKAIEGIKDLLKGICTDENETVYKYEPVNRTDMNFMLSNTTSGDLSITLNECHNDLIKKRRVNEKSTFYIPYEERLKLYHSASVISSNEEFRSFITRYIQNNKLVSRQDLTKFFKDKFGIFPDETKVINENSKEYLFTKVKYDIYIKNRIEHVEYNDYGVGTLQDVLKDLQRTRYVKSQHRNLTLDNIQPREEIRKRLDRKISIPIPNIDKYEERDSIYNMYFNIVFDILVVSGTLGFEDLLNKCNVLEDFELLNFLKVYEDVFEIEEMGNSKLVSLKLNIDPFEII